MDERLAKMRCSQWEDVDVALLALVVDLAERTVLKRLRGARGNTLIQTAFAKEWPLDGDGLGGLTVATARRAGLDLELAGATGLGERAVRNRLAKEPGQTLLMNAFEELRLDEDEVDEDEEANDDGDDDDVEPSASRFIDPKQLFAPVDLLGAIRLTSLKKSAGLLEWLAERLGRNALSVRLAIRARHGHGDVRAAFEDSWPVQVGPPPRGALGAMTAAAALRSPSLVRWVADIIGVPAPETWACLEEVHGRSRVDSVLPQMAGTAATESPRPPPAAGKPGGGSKLLDGRYELGAKLGEGAFGTVYEAVDVRHPKQRLVVKISRSDQSTLLEELRTAFDLNHPNICSYKHDGTDAEYGTYLVLQHGGESLANLIAREALSVEEALSVVGQAALGLDHAHSEDVVHQDIKPPNILVDRQPNRWTVRVADFGMARRGTRGENSMGQETLLASLIGYTPSYAAPEQLLYGRVTRSSDQYSLALVFCSILERRVFAKPYEFSELAQLTDAQNAALAKALSHEPRARFASCSAFAQALRSG